MKCRMADCQNEATCVPEMLLFATTRHPPAAALCDLPACNEHKDEIVSLDYLLTDEGWAQLVRGFRAAGKADPQRHLTQVREVPIGEQRVLEFYARKRGH